MALHTELPIHRTGVRLLDLAIKAQIQMPRTVKRALGEKITLMQACPYPFGSLAAQVFTDAFNAAKQSMAEACAPPPKVQPPQVDKMSGTYTPHANAYYRNDGNPHVRSAGVPC